MPNAKPLTPEEEAELARYEAPLTPEEEAELARYEGPARGGPLGQVGGGLLRLLDYPAGLARTAAAQFAQVTPEARPSGYLGVPAREILETAGVEEPRHQEKWDHQLEGKNG